MYLLSRKLAKKQQLQSVTIGDNSKDVRILNVKRTERCENVQYVEAGLSV